MKKTILFINLLVAAAIANAQIPKLEWAKNMGGKSTDAGTSIAVDDSGNVYTTGYLNETADFDPGSGTFNLTGGGTFISKLDAYGNFVWAKKIGSNFFKFES